MTDANAMAHRRHLGARGGPPGTIKEGFDKLELIDFDTRFTHARRGGGGYTSALRASNRHRAKNCDLEL